MPWYENSAGENLWYEEQGEGPPLVLLHGWCMSSAIWRFQMDQLCSSFRVIAPDLAGHGRSPAADGCHLEGFAADIAALFRHLDLSGALLAGWSLGAQAALQTVPLIIERLDGLVLICGTPCFTSRDGFPYGLSRVEADGMTLKIRRNIKRALDGFIARMFAPGELDDARLADDIRTLLAAVAVPETETALQSLEALTKADLRDELAAVALPTLLISGELDVICPASASTYMAGLISGCEQVMLKGCGHAPFLTRSAVFNKLLIEFLEKVQSAHA
jgi:pimeloyl-ACP methyl ester esterase